MWLLVTNSPSSRTNWIPLPNKIPTVSRGNTSLDAWYWLFRTKSQALSARENIYSKNKQSRPKMIIKLREVQRLPRGYS